MDYTRTAVRRLLGGTAHPGGEALTRHVLGRLALPTGALVADVACGDGAALRLLATQGLLGIGVDLEPAAVERARAHRQLAVLGDATALPLASGTYDAVLCECAVSTFEDPAGALAEMARVLRPGGAVAVTDVLLRRDLAAPGVVAAVDALTSARAMPDYVALLEGAGLRVVRTEDRAADALALCRRLARRLTLVGALRQGATARDCARAVEAGALGYGLLVAVRAG
ncbi:MAG: class I SAM-dependent methyltransferase [Actinobacteria bacterium]|nr:class I SAM-dependent methyltransferase [Actinomycetota bacterium]